MEKHVERLCHQIAGLAHVALARQDMTKMDLAKKLESIGSNITPIQLDDMLRAECPDLGARETAEVFFALGTKLTMQVAPIEAEQSEAE